MQIYDLSRYWEKIFNTMNDGLLLVHPDGTVFMVNQAFERMTGYSAAEVTGKPCTLLHCDACEKRLTSSERGWCTLFEKGQEIQCHCVVMRKDGSCLPVLKNATVLRDDNGAALGAVETLTDVSELEERVREIDDLSRQLEEDSSFHGLCGRAPAMQRLFHVITKAAQSDAPVVIYGESGTGKELAARAIHLLGKRRNGPFVQLNCAALNEALLESEFFGHIKGAFTGAYRHRIGRFEAADGGDFFLDEIGDVPLSIQVKLLRVLETKRFERVGDHQPISVDARIITATNKDLRQLVAQKLFREDFFFRINVIPIHIPPLRERTEDIPLLVNTFIKRLRHRTEKRIIGLSRAAMEEFMRYPWPGNVRELKSALEYAFVIAEDDLITPEHLPHQFLEGWNRAAGRFPGGKNHDLAEQEMLIQTLRECRGNQSEAARRLNISRVTVWNRMRKYGVDKASFRG